MTEIVIMDSFIDVSEVFPSEIVTALEKDSGITTEVMEESLISEEVIYNSLIV